MNDKIVAIFINKPISVAKKTKIIIVPIANNPIQKR